MISLQKKNFRMSYKPTEMIADINGKNYILLQLYVITKIIYILYVWQFGGSGFVVS